MTFKANNFMLSNTSLQIRIKFCINFLCIISPYNKRLKKYLNFISVI
jgi:hypothetical protein